MSIKRRISVFLLFIIASQAHAQFSNYELRTLEFVAGGGSSSTSFEDVASAQNELAIRYFRGTNGAEKNCEKGLYWFTESANNGNRYAQRNLARIYYEGEGVSIDKARARYWFEKSGSQHLHSASLMAGKMFFSGEGGAVDYYKAAKFFKDAAFGEIPEGMYLYAVCFAYGHGVQVDSTKALLWANRARDKGFDYSYWLLGTMYSSGLAVHRNKKIAKKYYEEGAERNVWNCMVELGDAYMTDVYGEKNINKAISYYTNAATQGSTLAMARLGDLYFHKDNGIYDLVRSAYWYQMLYDTGKGEDYYERLEAIYLYLNNYDNAAKLYLKRVELGDVDAMNSLAYYYADGKGVEKDINKAIAIIDKAISCAPYNPNYLDSKGEILLKKGDIKGATKIWKKINSNFPLYFQEYRKTHDGEGTNLDEYMTSKAK